VLTDRKLVKAVASALRDARQQAALTQQELAARIRMDRSYLSDIERGKASVSLEMFFQICTAMGASTSKVVGRIEKSLKK
jgi:transcriptional regulator with XRE-family HTH domain